MPEKLNPKIVSLSLATVVGILYILCAILFAIMPETAINLFKNLFHGLDITKITATNISLVSTIIGFVEILTYSLIAGWLFAIVYNYFLIKIK